MELLMRKAALLLALLAGCYDTSSAPSCRIQCATDADCTDGLTCGPGNLCTDGAQDCLQPETCTPDEFIACVDDMAHACNATGDGTTDTACEHGCNATERRCNDCVPDAMSCSTDMTSVQQCSPDGRTQNVADTCAAGCNPGDADVAAHCSYLAPAWLPDICDTVATVDAFAPNTSATLSTALDTNCDQIVVQMQNGSPIGPQICVIRAKTITIPQAVTLTFTGSRPIALVADSQLTVTGTLDVSADQSMNRSGPGLGGGNGGPPTSTSAGGGAGFGTTGGAGGGASGTGMGGAAGPAVDPLARAFFAGGYSAASSGGIMPNPVSDIFGGAGGGGILLIACRGNLSITGVIDANGAGGRPNHDQVAQDGVFTNSKGSSGGGTGGYVVLQGLGITLSGQIWANGGGGAGGGNVQDGGGQMGSKGQRAQSAAAGGVGNLSTGGQGGANSANGTAGAGSTAGGGFAAGGGGGAGVLQMYTPMGVTPVVTGATTSPPPVPRRNSVLR
jgi:hypothetical protein